MTQQAFEDFLTKKINLTPTEISQGAKSQAHIREILDNKSQGDESFPWLTDGDFLSGSYARDTKIKPLDDIDIMVVLDGTGLVAWDKGVQLNADVRGNGKLGSPAVNYLNDKSWGISSIKIIEIFKNALQESYPDSSIQKDGQAVNVWLDSYGLGLDIVPCFHIIPRDGSYERYFIPFGAGNSMWRATNPKIDEETCTLLNQQHDGKLKPVIKLIKYWNQTKNNGQLRSYHIEVMVLRIFSTQLYKISDYGQAIKCFFDNATNSLMRPCRDLTGLGTENVDSYLTPEKKTLILSELLRAQQIINTPTLVGFGRASNELNKWKKIFGDQFGI